MFLDSFCFNTAHQKGFYDLAYLKKNSKNFKRFNTAHQKGFYDSTIWNHEHRNEFQYGSPKRLLRPPDNQRVIKSLFMTNSMETWVAFAKAF